MAEIEKKKGNRKKQTNKQTKTKQTTTTKEKNKATDMILMTLSGTVKINLVKTTQSFHHVSV